jgi:PAS domain S-box-containing protein
VLGHVAVARYADEHWSAQRVPGFQGILPEWGLAAFRGGVWLVLQPSPLSNAVAVCLAENKVQAVEIPREILSQFGAGIHASGEGSPLWLYGAAGLYQWARPSGPWRAMTNVPGRSIVGVAERGNEFWVACTSSTGGTDGVARFRDGQWKSFPIGPVFGLSMGVDHSLVLPGRGRFAVIENDPEATPQEVTLPEDIRLDSVVRDADGTCWVGNVATVFRFVPDRLPPRTRVLNRGTNLLSGGTVTITASALERFRTEFTRADYAYSWCVDQEPWSPFRQDASRRLTAAELGVGMHEIAVRARDAGGDVDPNPAVFRFRVHSVPLQDRPWFLGAVAGVTVLLAFLTFVAVQARGELAGYARTLEAKVAERTAALQADLVNRRRAEDALRESEERWHFALEGAGDGLWDWNVETNRVHFSSHWKSILGYSDHEVSDRLEEWSDRVHPDDNAGVHEALQAHLDGRTPFYATEHRLRCRDGSYKWILDRGKVISRTPDGRPLRVIGTHSDISERKRVEEALQASEQRLNLTLDTLLEGCQIIGFDWRYLYVNRVAAEQGRRRRDELIGAKLTDVYPALTHSRLYEVLRRALEDRVAEKFENAFTYPDGTTAIFELEVRPVAVGVFIHSIDVTARRQAEQARGHLVQLIEHSTDFIAMADLSGRLTYLNPAGRRMIGFGENEKIEHLTLIEYIPEHWRDFMVNTLLPSVREKGLWEGEMQLRHLVTGVAIEVSRSTFLIRDRETGEPTGFATVTRDITPRKAAERAFRESEERFSKVFHANSAIIAISTYPEGQYVDVNEAFSELLGYSRQEVLGRRALDLGIWPVPAQREAVIAALERGEDVRGVECTIRAKNGRLHTFLASVERIELGGRPCILFINHDITVRKESEASVAEAEERFRQLAENIREVFWLVDSDHKQMLYVSPAYARIWGRSCESLYQSPDSWVEAIHPEDRARVAASLEVHGSVGTLNVEYRIIRPDGSLRTIHDRAFPVRDSSGAIYRVAGLAEDITERRKLEAQFRQAQKMEALGTLAGGIAHDFNNILGAIFGNVHLAGLDLDPRQSAVKNLSEIEKAASRAKSLVRQILAFSRQQPPARQNISLAPVIHEATSLLRASLPAGVELAKSIDGTCPNVFADASQIHQILLNLCTNAWHAMNNDRGRIEIQLRTETLEQDETGHTPGLHRGRYARLSVLDNGHGMDSATLERIFEPFFTTKEPGRGTGLGLSVVHGIVQSHDGIIRVFSQPGKGTEFHLYFPAIKAEVEGGSPEARALQRGAGQRILYVDDETALVDLAVRMLRRLAYEAEGHTRPAAALDALRTNPSRYQLIITDLHMPGLSGIEFIQNVRKIRPDIPVVLSSGFLTDEAAARARSLGVARLLHKPNTLEDLSHSIHELLGPKQP